VTQDEFNQIAWYDFMTWAFSDAATRAAFTAATGVLLGAPRTASEQVIDSATGHSTATLERFIEWATETIWGLEFAPKTYQEALAKRRREVTP